MLVRGSGVASLPMDTDTVRISRYLDEIGAEAEPRGDREWGVRLPSAKRGAVTALLTARERTLAVSAFFLRGPDRDHEAVYRRLLRKNLDTRDWRFAIDDDGDLYLLAETPLAGLDVDRLDGMLGSLSTLVDETYESVVRMGFAVPEGTTFGPPPSGV
jgi:Putative bacterial sensory transduction regulator